MSRLVELSRPRWWPRAAALALITIGIAGCSAESTRLTDSFGARGAEPTGSIPQAHAAPVGQVQAAQLEPASVAPTGGSVAARAPSAGYPEVTGSIAPRPGPSGHWTWDGGRPITVVQGDTVDGIARRYGVPASAIIHANSLTRPVALHPGQQLVIPRYKASALGTSAPAGRQTTAERKPVAAMSRAGSPFVHVVTSGETLSRIARAYGKPASEIAKANNLSVSARLNVGDRLVIPGLRMSAAKAGAAPALAQAKPAAAAPEPETAGTAVVFKPVAPEPPTRDAGKAADGTGALPRFRWPANGRVIAGFGPTTNGQQNDGINIALPENTPVKAAEDGVVAYAGNELKGYGNLVLVRHPNGYVTAYAHAKELMVKRGDQVKRGQIIARSGQTGNVNAPQLHFEVRKGASPLDPIKFLNGA
jgi:murein DD-endopeptidase MepM/ murein hydrolase activator NlpD